MSPQKEAVKEKMRASLREFHEIAYSYLHYSLPPQVQPLAEKYHKDSLDHGLRAIDLNAMADYHLLSNKCKYDGHAPATDPYSIYLASNYSCEKYKYGNGLKCSNCSQCKMTKELEDYSIGIRKKISKAVMTEVPGCGKISGSFFSNGACIGSRWNTRFQYGVEHWQDLFDLNIMPIHRLKAMAEWTLSWQNQDLKEGFLKPGSEFHEWSKEPMINESELQLLGYYFR